MYLQICPLRSVCASYVETAQFTYRPYLWERSTYLLKKGTGRALRWRKLLPSAKRRRKKHRALLPRIAYVVTSIFARQTEAATSGTLPLQHIFPMYAIIDETACSDRSGYGHTSIPSTCSSISSSLFFNPTSAASFPNHQFP